MVLTARTHPERTSFFVDVVSGLCCFNNVKNIFSLQHTFKFLFKDIKPLPDIFKILATSENDLS